MQSSWRRRFPLPPAQSFKFSPDKRSEKIGLVAVDLFAGAGGFSLGAKNLGIRVAAAVEQNKHACTTYRANFITRRKDPPKLYECDIEALEPQRIVDECLSPAGCCDLIMGGPPCQGFSVHRINDAGIDDPRNALLLRYFKYVEALAPKAFILENVPGMLWSRHGDYIKNFYALADKAGYDVKPPIVLNARDFGVPQNRKRVFVLGVLKGLSQQFLWPPQPTHFNPRTREVITEGKSPWRPASEVFGRAPPGDVNNVHMHHNAQVVRGFLSTPKNGGSRHESSRQLPCHKDHDGHKDVYGRIDPRVPGPTMTTACINPSKGRFLHPTQHHGITARQAARFQTFPDSFKFSGGLMAAGVQIGNAVPVMLATEVLRAIDDGLSGLKLDKAAA